MSTYNIIHIDNFAIPLERVSIDLQNRYLDAERAVACAPAGPPKNMAKSRLNEVTREILIEQTPFLMLKASPRAHGAAGFFEATRNRVLDAPANNLSKFPTAGNLRK
jgi:hypothetical protein